MVGLFSKVAPEQKRLVIDKKDEDMFKEIYKGCEGDKIVAVVNQWHVQGI